MSMEYDRSYVGVDPGKDGACVILLMKRGRVVCFERFIPPIVGKRVDYHAMFSKLVEWKKKYDPIHCVIEDVHSLFQSSKQSNFEFGRVTGAEEALIAAAEIPYTCVNPKVWQKEMCQGVPVVKKRSKKTGKLSNDTKAIALHAVRRLFPLFDLTKSDKASVPHDGIVDGILLADYAKRKYY